MRRDIMQLRGTGYTTYNRKKIINKYNCCSDGVGGIDINHYFYNDGNTLSCSFYGHSGDVEKLRYKINKDNNVYFYL